MNNTNNKLEEIRDHYYQYRVAFHMLKHPGTPKDKAYKYARVAWSRKVKQLAKKDSPDE